MTTCFLSITFKLIDFFFVPLMPTNEALLSSEAHVLQTEQEDAGMKLKYGMKMSLNVYKIACQ